MARTCGHVDDSHIRRGQPWSKDQCLECWWHYNDERYRRLDEGLPQLPTASPFPLARPMKDWPIPAKVLAKFRISSDKGLGDTASRRLAKLGANGLKWLYKKLTGRDCGCADRQAWLNQEFPYAP